MTAVSTIIQRAYREPNLIPIGTQPSIPQQTEALAVLNSGIVSLLGTVFGEQLGIWQVPRIQRVGETAANPPLLPGSARPAVQLDNNYPGKNVRLVWNGSEKTVYFPENPPDGARMALVKASGARGGTTPGALTLDGNGRTIGGADTLTLQAVPSELQWFYRADKADWQILNVPLVLTDQMPFPPEFDDFFITGLTMRLSSSYGKTIQATTTATNSRVQSAMRIRYWQPTDEGSGAEELVNAYESYYTGNDLT